MSLEAIQKFLTLYIRDPQFRDAYRNHAAHVEQQLDLSAQDRQLIQTIQLDHLDRAAVEIRSERMAKRQSEFKEFYDHLAAYVSEEEFNAEFDRENCMGWQSRALELDRFLAFSVDFLLRRGLPDYLMDLLRFCYFYCKIAETPREKVAGAFTGFPENGLRAYHRVHLRRPYRVVSFRYDVLSLVNMAPSRGLASMPPTPTDVFLQKNWSLAKRVHGYYSNAMPLLPKLLQGEQSVLDLMAHLPLRDFTSAAEHIGGLYRKGLIDISLPKPFIDEGIENTQIQGGRQ
jgi:hypothetical protein